MAVGLCGTAPAAARPGCQAAAAFVLGESVLKEGFDLEPDYVSWALARPSLPGSTLCAVRRMRRVVENGCPVRCAADAQAQPLGPACRGFVATVPRHPAFSINGLRVSTY